MKRYEIKVYVETLTVWAKDEAEAEEQYDAFFDEGICVNHETDFAECHCIEHADEVGHDIQEMA